MTSTLSPFLRISVSLCILCAGLILTAMLSGHWTLDSLLAFEAARPKNIAIYLADPRFGLAANVTNPRLNNTEPVWSPDGRLTFVASVLLNQDVFTLTLDQPTPINVSQTAHSHSPAWSPGGRLAYVTVTDSDYPDQINVLNPDGSRESYLTSQFPDLLSMEMPSWLSEHELVFIGRINHAQKQVFLLDLDDHHLRNISNQLALIHNEPLGSPDGEWVAFVSADLSRANGEQSVSVWDKASGTVVQVTHNTGLNGELSWSRDGQRLAFASTLSGNSEIYVWDAQSRSLTNVSNDASVDEFPSWAANGDLAFVSNRAGEAGIYTLDPRTLVIETVYILHGSSFPVWSN